MGFLFDEERRFVCFSAIPIMGILIPILGTGKLDVADHAGRLRTA
jgi:hypothetical protein